MPWAANSRGMPVGDTIAVIGDGAITAGMAYEAMNHAGHLKSRLFVILNDNDMSIAPPVGALQRYLNQIADKGPFATLKAVADGVEAHLPGHIRDGARRARQMVTGMPGGATLFEEFGFEYIGPVDGHDMPQLLATLRAARARDRRPRSCSTSVTRKGPRLPARRRWRSDRLPWRREVRRRHAAKQAKASVERAHPTRQGLRPAPDRTRPARDPSVVAITAAMPTGTGLDQSSPSRFPARLL
jgi:1-deoxy-D-xylulose-5-phosphate synthase